MSTEWPDRSARRAFEAEMLEHHAIELAARYPETIWPNAGRTDGTERDGAVAQQAFVAGVRFACDQLRGTAAEIRSDTDGDR